jgi:hypothetical protein
MPFYRDGTLIFCTSQQITQRQFRSSDTTVRDTEYRPWKLALADWETGAIRSLETGLPEDVIHCNPMFHVEDGVIRVSFIAGFPHEVAIHYLMYEMHGTSWDTLSEPQKVSEEFTCMGFISPRHICSGDTQTLYLTDKEDGSRFRVKTLFEAILRAAYDPDCPTRLIITGMDECDQYRTVIYDTVSHETLEINGPAPTYKACLVGNRIAFARRETEDIEDYQLCTAPFVLEATDKAITLEPV